MRRRTKPHCGGGATPMGASFRSRSHALDEVGRRIRSQRDRKRANTKQNPHTAGLHEVSPLTRYPGGKCQRSMSAIAISQQLSHDLEFRQSSSSQHSYISGALVLFRGRYRHSHDCGQHGCNRLLFAAIDGKGIRRTNCQRPPCFLHLRPNHEDLARSGC